MYVNCQPPEKPHPPIVLRRTSGPTEELGTGFLVGSAKLGLKKFTKKKIDFGDMLEFYQDMLSPIVKYLVS